MEFRLLETPRLRVLNLLLAGRVGAPNYSISFGVDEARWRPLSVIAGESQTGKTSVLEFILYCLGGRTFPLHPEVAGAVRSAELDAILAGDRVRIERPAAMQPSTTAILQVISADEVSDERLIIEPTTDPSSLSQKVLRAFDLDGVALPQAPTQEASDVDTLSIRDLMRIIWLPNDRLDSKNLVFEHNHVVARKFRQTVDAIFGVDDAKGASLAANLKLARQDLKEAEGVARSIRSVVASEYPEGVAGLEISQDAATRQLESLRRELADADRNMQTHGASVTRLKSRLQQTQVRVAETSLRVGNRRSLLIRLASLRSQYIDDEKKLIFLSEADRLFNPLQITVCPACLSNLPQSPVIENDQCTLCGERVPQSESSDIAPQGHITVRDELRALRRRLSELEAYIARLEIDLLRLEDAEHAATELYESTAESLESVSNVPAPFLALRDDFQKQIAGSLVDKRQADTGLRLWQSVAEADQKVDALVARINRLKEERAQSAGGADRSSVISSLSARFGRILGDIGYPKLSEPYLDDKLIPHVRGLPYTSASSGGQVLISLAWYLSVWEVAYETGARSPGLLMIDSPQKNLGHRAVAGDSEFGDFGLVENFYRHVKQWLAGPGSGAQLIVVDNTPPDSVVDDIVVRFSRNPAVPPYGLITDAVD